MHVLRELRDLLLVRLRDAKSFPLFLRRMKFLEEAAQPGGQVLPACRQHGRHLVVLLFRCRNHSFLPIQGLRQRADEHLERTNGFKSLDVALANKCFELDLIRLN